MFYKLTTIISLLIVFSVSVYSQTIKASVSFLGTEIPVTNSPNDVNSAVQGFSADFDAKIVEKNNFRLGGVFNYQRPVVDNGFDIYSFGPQLSYKIGFVEPFASALFGFSKASNTRYFTRSYRGGVDLNFGHVFIRPFFVQYQYIEDTEVNSLRQYGAGVGVRF